MNKDSETWESIKDFFRLCFIKTACYNTWFLFALWEKLEYRYNIIRTL